MKAQVAERQDALVAALGAALAPGGPCALDAAVPARVWRRALAGPAAEFLARPGKEVRAQIVRIGWNLGGGARDRMPDGLALAVELLHAGSLIIDDVQDGALERRGAPALHLQIGVPLAINTGSWMYFWALAELDGACLSPVAALGAHRLATATLVRCHQGQALDLAARVGELDAAEVPGVVAATTRLKTGALCRFAAELGALAAGASGARRAAVGELGEAVGVAVQMLDDAGSILRASRRAKGDEDLRGGRPTWPWAWLAESGDRFEWARLTALLRAVVDGADPTALADALGAAIASIAPRRIRAHLDGTRAMLERARGELGAAGVAEAEALLRGLEARYA